MQITIGNAKKTIPIFPCISTDSGKQCPSPSLIIFLTPYRFFIILEETAMSLNGGLYDRFRKTKKTVCYENSRAEGSNK
jgi:hypothetical protein